MVRPPGRVGPRPQPGPRFRRRVHRPPAGTLRPHPLRSGCRGLYRARPALVRVRALDPPARHRDGRKVKATRVLVVSPKAGSMNEEIDRKLRKSFADHLIVDFDPNEDLGEVMSDRARIVVAGGDGTVEFI